MTLTAKQKCFVQEYLVDLNATQAAIRAGYSEKTADQQGSRLLINVKVAAAITKAKAKRSDRTEISQDRVLQELAKIGFSDLRKVLTKNGHLIDPQDWDDDTAGAISSLEVVARHSSDEAPIEFTHKIKLHDKLGALEKIGKHLGMFDGKGGDDDKAPTLNINITSNAPVNDVRVTRSES